MSSPKVHDAEVATTTAMSPKRDTTEMDFYEALKAILEGERVTRLEWPGPEHYCLMYNHRIHIHRPDDGKLHPWIIQDGDMAGEDWVIL